MPASSRQLRKTKPIYYGKRPPPWFPPKSRSASCINNKRRPISRKAARAKTKAIAPRKNQSLRGTAASTDSDADTSSCTIAEVRWLHWFGCGEFVPRSLCRCYPCHQAKMPHLYCTRSDHRLQDSDATAEPSSSFGKGQLKRARTTTIVGDDKVVSGRITTPPSRKRRKACEPSQVHTPTLTPSSAQIGKAPSDLSPATEAAILQMPKDIKDAIKTLKSIRKYVNGLLEFKAILDYRQQEIYQMAEGVGH
jgi:hypothetical protein